MCAVNGKFLAAVVDDPRGRAFLVVPLSKVRRLVLWCPRTHEGSNTSSQSVRDFALFSSIDNIPTVGILSMVIYAIDNLYLLSMFLAR